MKIIIIGGVAGGATTAARLRRLDEKAEILLFEKGEYVSYANCGLPYYIGDVITERESLFVQTVKGFTSRFRIDIRVKSEVKSINQQEKTITVLKLDTNETYTENYDKLVISTGAEPIKPPFKGVENDKIFTLRNVPDTDRIKKYVVEQKPQSAIVIGGGFIGLEMVENLNEVGLKVCIVEKANQVMAPIDFSMASIVHQHLTQKGIDLYLEESVESFEQVATGIKAKLESGKEIIADMVILSIGVKPDVKIVSDAGLALGVMGGIKINEYMQTSNKDIYALGDATEVFNPIINKHMLIPLAGPANKQGRIVANNIIDGNKHKYIGSIGTSIAKVFDLTVGSTGASTKLLDREGINHVSSYTHGNSHAGYYPNALPLSIKINFSPTDGKLLGAQVVGCDGVDKRIDLLADVIKKGGTIYDLTEIEHAYAPPYSSAKDPVNMAGFVAENILSNKVKIINWREISNIDLENTVLLDVRTKGEYEFGKIEGSINIPVDELRERLSEIPKNKKIITYCAVGLRGYIAYRILSQLGFDNIFNLSGGYKTYSVATTQVKKKGNDMTSNKNTQYISEIATNKQILKINACGLQCPGPIMQLKKNYDKIEVGERLEIKVTDMAFGEDLKGWCHMMGARIIDINTSGGVLTACVEKSEKKNCHASPTDNNENSTIVVFSEDLDKALASFVIANGAAASGKKVSLFFTFWGLSVIKKVKKTAVKRDFLGKMFNMMLPSNSKKLGLSKMNMFGLGSVMMRYVMKKKNIDSLEKLMNDAIENGVELIACSMSMDVMGVDKEDLIDHVTIGGVGAYLDRADGANVNLFI